MIAETMKTAESPFFDIRAIYECGWNIFNRKGYSNDPQDISVNYIYLDHLAKSGINWLIVFWTNSDGFEESWGKAVRYGHSLGIKFARGVYGFSAGGPEYDCAEPDAPEELLVDSPKGFKTALCPFDGMAKDWIKSIIPKRLGPDMDGIAIEPARAISRNCVCSKCQKLRPCQLPTSEDVGL